ncbi:hypothetical protein D3C87_278310 [compost metagenome]
MTFDELCALPEEEQQAFIKKAGTLELLKIAGEGVKQSSAHWEELFTQAEAVSKVH